MNTAQEKEALLWGVVGVTLFAATLPMTRLAVGPSDAPQLSPWFVTWARCALAGMLSLAYLPYPFVYLAIPLMLAAVSLEQYATAVLAVIAWVTDYFATVLGAKKAGASKLAIIGAALGTIAGIFMGLVGVLFMPFVGAVIGEYIAQKNTRQAAKVGLATWLGLIVGTIVKLVLVFMMIGIFVAALVFTG